MNTLPVPPRRVLPPITGPRPIPTRPAFSFDEFMGHFRNALLDNGLKLDSPSDVMTSSQNTSEKDEQILAAWRAMRNRYGVESHERAWWKRQEVLNRIEAQRQALLEQAREELR